MTSRTASTASGVPLGFDERLAGGVKRPTVSRGGVRSLVFRVLAAGTDFLVVLVTARAFGATGRGLYALAAFAASLALTALGGAAQALAAEHAHGRTPLSRLYAASATLAAAGGGVIALAIDGRVAIIAAQVVLVVYVFGGLVWGLGQEARHGRPLAGGGSRD